MIKTVYQFPVTLQQKKVVKDVKEENGTKTTVEVEKEIPTSYTFFLKRPSRAEREEADIERAAHLSYCIQRGVITEAVLSKTYANLGGVLSNEDQKYYAGLLYTLKEETEKFHKLALESNTATEEEKRANFDLLMSTRKKIIDFQMEQEEFFSNTAETKAKVKYIEVLMMLLTYFQDESGADPKPFFAGADYREKLASAEKMEENNDPLFLAVKERLSFLYSVLVSSDGAITEAELKKIDEENG